MLNWLDPLNALGSDAIGKYCGTQVSGLPNGLHPFRASVAIPSVGTVVSCVSGVPNVLHPFRASVAMPSAGAEASSYKDKEKIQRLLCTKKNSTFPIINVSDYYDSLFRA